MHKEFRKFGFSLGLGLNILGCILFYRHREHFIWFSAIGSLILIIALTAPNLLKPLKKILDAIIKSIGWLITMLSLLIAFYLIFSAIALILRLFRKDFLNQKIDRNATTYWIKRKQGVFIREFYERMG